MFHVERDEKGSIRHIQRRPLEGDGIEKLSDDHPEIVAFLSRNESNAPVLHAPAFETLLTLLRIDMSAFLAELERTTLSVEQKAYHSARFRRSARFQRDDAVLNEVLGGLGFTGSDLDKAWERAEKIAENEGL